MAEVYNNDFMVTPRALRKSCPNLPDEVFFWRLLCVYGVMVYVQADTGKIQTIAGTGFDTSRPDVALEYILPFVTAGMQAPHRAKRASGRRRAKSIRKIRATQTGASPA